MRVLALDVGERRIGVALSDPTATLATPLTTLVRGEEPWDGAAVLRLIDEHGVEEIVVGLPIEMSGRLGPQARIVADFSRLLAERTSVPIRSVDERLSSVQAERLLRDAGVEPSRDKARVDAAAAAVILQAYLDSKRASTD